MEKQNKEESNNHIQQGINDLQQTQTPEDLSLAVPKEILEFVLSDIEETLKEFYSSIDKTNRRQFDKIFKDKNNMKLIANLLVKFYLKQAEKNKPKTREYIG